MADLHRTDPMFNKYFQDRRIRRYLINAGLINRHGDILPLSADQTALARRITQLQISANQVKKEEEESHHASVKRSRLEKNKDSKQSHRGVSRSLLSIDRSPLPTNKKRSRKRTKSAHHQSQDLKKQSARSSARVKSPTKDRCRVTMIYYGPRTNFDYDNCWFKPDGDEISVLQQHCGGENLTVYKGYVKPNETFAFESRRHPDYPFALALYVNGFIKSRISVCCEYRHRHNIPLDGKHGLFGIRTVRKGKPCLSCEHIRRKKKLQADVILAFKQSRYEKSPVSRSSSRDRSTSPFLRQTPSPSHDAVVVKYRSPVISRTPSPRDTETEKKPSNISRILVASPEVEEKKPSILSMKDSPGHLINNNSNTHNSAPLQNDDDDDSYVSDFEESNDNDPPTSNPRFGRPRISDSYSIGDQIGSNNSPKASKQSDSSDDEDSGSRSETTAGKNDTFNHSKKLPADIQRKADPSDDESDHYTTRISTERKNIADSSQSSVSRISNKSDLLLKHEIKRELNYQKNNTRFSSITTSENRQSSSSSTDHSRKDTHDLLKKDPKVRRISTSSSEDLFGDKHSSSKEKKKTAPDDTNATKLDLIHGAESWLGDTSSDQDD